MDLYCWLVRLNALEVVQNLLSAHLSPRIYRRLLIPKAKQQLTCTNQFVYFSAVVTLTTYATYAKSQASRLWSRRY